MKKEYTFDFPDGSGFQRHFPNLRRPEGKPCRIRGRTHDGKTAAEIMQIFIEQQKEKQQNTK